MASQIAVRIPDEQLRALDEAIGAGEFDSRSAMVREALQRLLRERQEREIAGQYRRAYGRQPLEPELGEAGAELLAEALEREGS
jgi:Arc/MetJ-type ribon-helix-helix transcriptional regulator